MRDFTKLQIWERSYKFALKIYKVTYRFPKEELYSLTSQIRRAAYSIPANIAEGSAKPNQSDFLRYIDIASGSAAEMHTHLMFSKDLNYLPQDIYDECIKELIEIRKMLSSFVISIKKAKD